MAEQRVHVVDRVTWFMGSQAASVSASIGTRAHYQAGDDSATAFIRYKNGLAGVAVSVALRTADRSTTRT